MEKNQTQEKRIIQNVTLKLLTVENVVERPINKKAVRKEDEVYPVTAIKRTKSSIYTNKGKDRKIVICGHRGAGVHAPPNSLEACKWSIENKLDLIEIDVWLTKDDQVVVMHGDKDSKGKVIINKQEHYIKEVLYKDLKEKAETTETMPTLGELLDVCKGKLKIAIELKGILKNGPDLALPVKVIDLIIKKQMLDQIQIWSFEHAAFYPIIRQRLKELGITQRIPLGHSFMENQNCPDISKIEKGDLIVFSTALLYDAKQLPQLIKAREKGILLSGWIPVKNIENDTLYDRMARLGITVFCSNTPLMVRAYKMKHQFQ